MVAQFSQNSPLPLERKKALIAALQSLPHTWAVVPVNGNKAPYRKDWQKRVMRCPELIGEIQSNRAKGFGLLTGELSGGILAIDCDGEAAHALLAKYGELPRTVAFTSGRPGRCQYLLQVPKEFWGAIKSLKLDAEGQELGFRWNGQQSVLPPSVHPETGEYKWVNSPDETKIAECPTWVIESILNAGDRASSPPTPVLPVQSSPSVKNPKKLDDIDLPVPASVPLEACLAKETRALLTGVAAGARNESGIKVARDLLGTANYLKLIGQPFDGEPQQLFQDFAARCSPPLPSKETDTIWRSAEKTNPAPACREEGVKNCLRGWYWSNYLKPINSRNELAKPTPQNNVVQFPAAPEEKYDEWLLNQINQLIEKDLIGSKLDVAIAKIAKIGKISDQQIRKIYDHLIQESHREEDRAGTAADLDRLLEAKGARIDISRVLPATLANPIKLLAEQLGLRPECYLTVLLTAVSTLHRNNSCVRLWDATDFEVTLNLFAAIVSDPSQYKSPILRAIATKALSLLQKEAKEEFEKQLHEHNEAVERYEAEMTEWRAKSRDKRGEKPQEPTPPVRRIYYFTDATSEGIVRRFQDCPEAGLLNLVDELAGKFKSNNKYSNGRGSDEEDLLSLYDGAGKVTLRANGIKSDLEDGLHFGLIGSIQPRVLQGFLRGCEDSNGHWARFMFVNQPLAMAEWSHDSGKVDLTPLLVKLYSKISHLPATTYTLSPEAKEEFRLARNRAEKLRVSEVRPGMRAYWGKVPGRIGKLAGNLHVIHSLVDGESVPTEIPARRVREAIALCDFYAEQVLSLYAEFENDEALPPKLAKILEIAANKGGTATLRDIARSTNWKADQVREGCEELQKMGRGSLTEIKQPGKRAAIAFQISENSKVSVSVSESVSSLLTLKTLENKGFEQSVETVSKCQYFSESFSTESDSPRSECLTPPSGVEEQSQKSLTLTTLTDTFQNPFPERIQSVGESVGESVSGTDTLKFSIGDRVILAAKPENIGTITRIESGAYGAEFPCTTQAGEPGIDFSLYEAAELRLAPPVKPSLGISIPAAPPDGNPKGRRINR